MGVPPGRGWSRRALLSCAALPCLLASLDGVPAAAQSLTAQSFIPDLFNPTPGAPASGNLFSGNSASGGSTSPDEPQARGKVSSELKRLNQPADLRIGQPPTYGSPAASGAAHSGYDSLNRTRKQPKYYPGHAPGPGTKPRPSPPTSSLGHPAITLPPSATANRTPVPPALAGTVPGQPQRRRLKSDDDPFGAVGDYAGSFLLKGAVELSGGYDSNPARINKPISLSSYVIAPELLVVSDWERHALVADLRGSFTGYGGQLPATIDGFASPAPTNIDRPQFTGHIDGRLDVNRDLRLMSQLRLTLGTDNPGSPNIQAGLASYPIFTTVGGTVGIDQTFNRLQLSAGATIDRTSYTESKLTDGTKSSNDDRNFNQYGGVGRVSYELKPGLKPFVEVEGDTRVHDVAFDRDGYRRDSSGGYAKVGTSFEFTRILTGELSVGYAARDYVDPRLNRLEGLLTTASLVWGVSGLTTAKFLTDTQIAETTIPGASGVLVRTYTVEVDHDLRRWLTAIGKFTYGTLDYQGLQRNDRTYSLEGDVIYKLNRSLWVKGSLRHDILDSNEVGASSAATVGMLGVRLQN